MTKTTKRENVYFIEMGDLFKAVRRGDLQFLSSYLSQGGNVNIIFNHIDGMTILHYACRFGHLELVKCLVENGADIHLCANNKYTALHCAAISKNISIVAYLISSGANIFFLTDTDSSVLQWACIYGNLEIVKYLIGLGADPYATNKIGENAFDIACKKNHPPLVEYLGSLMYPRDLIGWFSSS